MNWQTLMLMQCLLVAVSVILMRRLAVDRHIAKAPYALTAGQYVVQYVVGIVCVLGLGQHLEPVLGRYWYLFILNGLAFSTVNFFTFKMLVYIDAAIGTIISTLGTLAAAMGAMLVLSEKITWLQAGAAAVLLMTVIYAVNLARSVTHKSKHKNILSGVVFGLIAALAFGVAAVTEKYLLSRMNLGTYLVYGWGSQIAAAMAVALLIQPKAFSIFKQQRIISYGVFIGLAKSLGGLCYLVATIRTDNLALISLITNFRLIVVVLLAAFFLGERAKLQQKLGAATLALLALTVMFWI